MALRRMLGVIMLVIATSAAMVAPAAAAGPYGPKPGAITVSKTLVTQGKSVVVRADGYRANVSVKVSVSSTGHRSTFTEGSNGGGVVATRIKLTNLGSNTISISGADAVTGTQSLRTKVRVVRYHGNAHADDQSVTKGERVKVWSTGFCKSRSVTVRVLDDGNEYKRIMVRSDRKGHAGTTVKLTRAGTTTLILSGCRAKGFQQAHAVNIRVRNATSKSFTASPSAYVGDVASGASPAAYAGLAGGLLVLFAAGQLVLGRRRRS
jgi:hypothetical protein